MISMSRSLPMVKKNCLDVEEYEQEQEDELYIDNTSETVSEHAKVSMKTGVDVLKVVC